VDVELKETKSVVEKPRTTERVDMGYVGSIKWVTIADGSVEGMMPYRARPTK
jgi:hypothetical protein